MRTTAFAILFAALPALASAQDDATRCVDVEIATEGARATFQFANSCPHPVYFEWCWERTYRDSVECSDADSVSEAQRGSRQSMLDPRQTAAARSFGVKPGGSYWFAACRVSGNTDDEDLEGYYKCGIGPARVDPDHATGDAGWGGVLFTGGTGRGRPVSARQLP